MKDILTAGDAPMDFLEVPRHADHHTFYLSSCESAAGVDAHDSNISSRCSSLSSTSSLHVGLPTPDSPVHTNVFLHVLKRLHCLTLRRKKNGRYRSLPTSLHLFFKKQQPQPSIDISQSTVDFWKSPSTSHLPTNRTDTEPTRKHASCPLIFYTGAANDRTPNSKTLDSPSCASFLRHLRRSDKTVSEDNNTHTLSSVDLAATPHVLPTLLISDTTSLVSPVQQQPLNSFDYSRVSARLSFCVAPPTNLPRLDIPRISRLLFVCARAHSRVEK